MKPVMFCRNSSGILRWAAQLDEVRALQRRLAEQDAVVGDDAHRIAVDAGKAADQRGAVARLEFVAAIRLRPPVFNVATIERRR
jgi:hypothetical protein